MNHKTRWTPQKIARRIALLTPLVYRRRRPLASFRYLPLPGPEAEPPVTAGVDDSGWETIAPHTYWGRWRTDFVLRTTFTVPGDWPAGDPVALFLPLGDAGDFGHPETLAYIDGTPYAAADRYHREILLPAGMRDDRPHLLALHGWTGRGGWVRDDANEATRLLLGECAVVHIDRPLRAFLTTARVALEVAAELDENDPAQGHLYTALNDAFQRLDTREPLAESFYASVPAAHATLQAGIANAAPPLDVTIVASGHAHLDIAWLWRVAQSRRKVGRTFHTVLHLMEQFPDFRFTQSQPQLYDYVRHDYPEAFAAIQARVAEGRWEPLGAMWVEADCNLSGAEALARQFLLGQTFFRAHFGPDAASPILWLPDVFGYAWNLPQLINQAGLSYFFTIKISWNQYNRIPYDSFWWQGLDGTRVLTHFGTTASDDPLPGSDTRPSTYSASVTPRQVFATWRNWQQKEAHRELFMAFGFGDGGGGPTRAMLENLNALSAFPATPRLRHGTALDFFTNLEAGAGDHLPTWNGELYLEYHRGTYTTQARSKRYNRRSEFLLHDAEFLASWATLAAAYDYPHAALTRAWQLLCLNQFHDILPGSSVAAVYADSARDYETIRTLAEDVRERALLALARRLPAPADVLAVNPTSFAGPQVGLLPEPLPAGQGLVDARNGAPLVTQPVTGGTLVALPYLAPYSIVPLGLTGTPPDTGEETLHARRQDGAFLLENALLRVVFDGSGELVSLFDKAAARHVLAAGQHANHFQAFEDRPLDWDAWDIELYYDEKEWDLGPAHSIRVCEEGPLRAGLEIRRRLLHSDMVQRVYLYRGSRRLDFDTWIDWRERHVLLKVAFPVDILSPVATFDVQWGNVQRPTHRNTSWDWARFESCAHKWVDLSEGDYGVSLLNDCKYGHDIQGNVLRLTLLRSPTYPDPDADQGEHRFTYSLLPHPGDWRAGTVPAAYALNDPPLLRRVTAAGDGHLPPSLVAVDAPNVIVETVKQAEDGNGLIVRIYENERCRGPVTLHTGFPLAAAARCNLLEEDDETLVTAGNAVRFTMRPYQIVTLRLIPASHTGT